VAAVRAEGLFKIFGRRPDEAVRRLESGAGRAEIEKLGATPAVIDASFEVEPGEIFVVMGLSGSGKSTLIRMLNGLVEATAGHVFVGDDDLAALDAAGLRRVRQQRMSMVFQHFALLPHRSVIDNVAYGLEVRGIARAARHAAARKTLAMVNLAGWEDKLPGQLSGGMKQRVGLARALAAETDIMLMDEAFSALDPLIRREMQDQLVELQSTLGKTIVFITHDLNEAMRLGDRIAVMRDGRIVQIGTAEEILNAPANDYVAQFVADVDRARVLTAARVMVPPASVVSEASGPRAALHTMSEGQTSAVFVVSRDRVLRGVISDDAAIAALKRGDTSLLGMVDRDVVTVGPDDVLADVFAPCAESPVPVAVVGETGKLLGVIPRVTLLAAMANASGDGEPSADAPPLVSTGGTF
jgi:glycine betaine/proline transport system ATP-binding protein